MIKVQIELELVFPYKRSMVILSEFCSLWDSTILYGGTKIRKSVISMPIAHFKKIFKENPIKKEYQVPAGMERFVELLRVKKITTR